MSELEAVAFFIKDHKYAQNASNALDQKITDDSEHAAGLEYAAITALSLRAFSQLQFAGTREKPLIFAKTLDLPGHNNSVEAVYRSLPMLLYLNPKLLKYALIPILEYGKRYDTLAIS